MPRQPTEAEKDEYNVEAHIERKVTLMHMHETEIDFLRLDPECSDKVWEKLNENNVMYEGYLPPDPELAKIFLEECEGIVEQTATTLVEHHAKAGAAMALSMHMTRKEAEFPQHVTLYILHEYDTRLDNLSEEEPSDDERAYMERLDEQKRKRVANIPAAALNLNPNAGIPIDENLAESLLNDADSMEKKTFVLQDSYGKEEDLEDATKFRVVGWGKSINAPSPFWEIVHDYDDYDFPMRVDREEMKDLLLSSTVYKD